MKQIVCGIDASRESRHAAEVAVALCDLLGAEPVLVTVVEDPLSIPYRDEAQHERDRRCALADGRRVFEELGIGLLDDDSPERLVVLGKPAVALPYVAERRGAMLLCVGSRGQGRLRAALVGSVSADVARTATRPVMIVSSTATLDSVEDGSVVCGIDGSDVSLAAAGVASRLAEELVADLVFVQARARSWGTSAHPFSAFYATAGANTVVRRVVSVADPPEALHAVATDERARLIVVGSRGLSPAQSVVLGSTSMEVAGSSPCPVVVVPEAVGTAPAVGITARPGRA
jgi:nucleotide-binding universal stress UspA family protein